MELRLGGWVKLGRFPAKETVEGDDEGAFVVDAENVLVVGRTNLTGLRIVADPFVAGFKVVTVTSAFEFAGLDERLVPWLPAFFLPHHWLAANVRPVVVAI